MLVEQHAHVQPPDQHCRDIGSSLQLVTFVSHSLGQSAAVPAHRLMIIAYWSRVSQPATTTISALSWQWFISSTGDTYWGSQLLFRHIGLWSAYWSRVSQPATTTRLALHVVTVVHLFNWCHVNRWRLHITLLHHTARGIQGNRLRLCRRKTLLSYCTNSCCVLYYNNIICLTLRRKRSLTMISILHSRSTEWLYTYAPGSVYNSPSLHSVPTHVCNLDPAREGHSLKPCCSQLT